MKKPPKRRTQANKAKAGPKPSRGPTPPQVEEFRVSPTWLAYMLQRSQCPVCNGGDCTGMPGCVERRE